MALDIIYFQTIQSAGTLYVVLSTVELLFLPIKDGSTLRHATIERSYTRIKKSKKISLVPRASTSKILLVLLPIKLSLSRKNKLALNFLLVRRTLGENMCLSCLKFNLSRAPGQVIF